MDGESMSKKNKNVENDNKFQFVEMDEKNLEITKTLSLNDITQEIKRQELEKEKDSEVNEKGKKKVANEVEEKFVPQQEVVEKPLEDIVPPEVVEEKRVERLNKKVHFSFEARVITLVVCILLLFTGACLLILEAVRSGKNEVVSYNETSTVGYNVCLFPNDTYHQECLEENMEYVSKLSKTIGAYFQYNVDFSTEISYDLAYHVSAITKIYDSEDPTKVLYRTEDTLVDKTSFEDTDTMISIDTDVSLDFQKYYGAVRDYQERYALKSAAEVEVILYLDETTETRKVASLIIPLGKDTYHIKKDVISNENREVEIEGEFWNDYNITCAILASVMIIISLTLLYSTARLVLKVTTNHNKYQQRLSQILRDYDRIIVIARNGYESNIERKVVKVESFEELLDAQNTLQKPIVYSRINDVKSEFIVEDDTTLYKYVLKESKM